MSGKWPSWKGLDEGSVYTGVLFRCHRGLISFLELGPESSSFYSSFMLMQHR